MLDILSDRRRTTNPPATLIMDRSKVVSQEASVLAILSFPTILLVLQTLLYMVRT
jgi:hypothetical protein